MATSSKGVRFLGKQSSMAPRHDPEGVGGGCEAAEAVEIPEQMSDAIQLLYYASQGDVAAVESLLSKGVDVNASDFDKRTALHVACCEGKKDVVELLIRNGAHVNAKDRWGSTPLADADHYGFDDVSTVLRSCNAKTSRIKASNVDIPDYEVNPDELVTSSIREDSLRWRGTVVYVKMIDRDENLKQFMAELSLLLKLRHPNIVQFLGAVTQRQPMMFITEYLPCGDLQQYFKKKPKPLKPKKALKFALDIARGLNYVHEWKPEPIVHGNLKPSNLLRDMAGHVKIADFAFSNPIDHDEFVRTSGRYMAPELYLRHSYDRKVDVFSFALILQQMMEGCPPFPHEKPEEAAKAYSEGKRPPFKVKPRYYPNGLKELIMRCWHEEPSERPTFSEIIKELENIKKSYGQDSFKNFVTRIRYSKLCGR